jgi:hypothetical protein
MALACYFVSCLRLDHFREWKYDGDVKDVYYVLAHYNHSHGVREKRRTGVTSHR